MILEGNLCIHYNDEYFDLVVKTILKNGIYYFFVSDKDKGKSLLSGETLQLTYTESFNNRNQETNSNLNEIPGEIVGAIETMLLDNKQLWVY